MAMRARASRSKSVTSRPAGSLQRMNVEIDQRAGGVFDRGKALVEGAAGEQAIEQRLRHRLAGLAVPGVGFQDLRHLQPVLVKLRGQFDEVAGHRGAGEQRIGHVGQQAVQRMAEFVEQRARVVEGEQRRLAGGGLGEVADIDDDRADIAGELFLVAQRGHPGARMLGGAGEIVADEQADVAARSVLDLPGARVGVIERHVDGREGEAEQPRARSRRPPRSCARAGSKA